MSSTWSSSLLLMTLPAFQYCLCPRVKSKLNIFPTLPMPIGRALLLFRYHFCCKNSGSKSAQ